MTTNLITQIKTTLLNELKKVICQGLLLKLDKYYKCVSFSGGYSRVGLDENNVPFYRHTEDWEARYDAEDDLWTFTDPRDIIGVLRDTTNARQIYPETGHIWVHRIDKEIQDVFVNLDITCVGN